MSNYISIVDSADFAWSGKVSKMLANQEQLQNQSYILSYKVTQVKLRRLIFAFQLHFCP